MTGKGVWARGVCTVAISAATVLGSSIQNYTDAWGPKEWTNTTVAVIIALSVSIRGFLDQSISDAKVTTDEENSVIDGHVDAAERVPGRKAR